MAGIVPAAEETIDQPVRLVSERHVEPSKGFLLNVKFWVMF